MFSRGKGVERCDLLGRKAHGDHLHGVGPTPGTPSPAALQLLDVVPSLGLVRPLLICSSITCSSPTMTKSYNENLET